MAISRGFPPSNTISPSVRITEKDYSYVPVQPSYHKAAVVGFASKGPINVPTLVTTVRDLHTVFGFPHPDTSDPYMIYAAEQYLAYSNQCYVVRIAIDDPVNDEAAQIASVEIPSAGRLVYVVASQDGPYSFSRDAMFRWKLNGVLASKVLVVPGGTSLVPISYTAAELVDILNSQLDFVQDGIQFEILSSNNNRIALYATWAFGPASTIEIMSVKNSMTGNTVVDDNPLTMGTPKAGPVGFGTLMTVAKVTGAVARYPDASPVLPGHWTFTSDVILNVVIDGTDSVLIDNVVQVVTIPHNNAPSTPATYTTQNIVDLINMHLPDPHAYTQPDPLVLPGGFVARANGNFVEIVTTCCGNNSRMLIKSTTNGSLIFGFSSITAYGYSPANQSITPIDNRDTLGIIFGEVAAPTDYSFKLTADSPGIEGNSTYVTIKNDINDATFTMMVYNHGQQVESWGMLSKDITSSYYVEPFLAAYSDYVRCEDSTDPVLQPTPPADNVTTGYGLVGGSDGIPTDPDDQDILIIGSAGNYTGLYSLSEPEQIDIDLVAVPGHSSTVVVKALIDLCENYRMDCMAIIDPPFGLNPLEIVQWQNGTHPLNNTRFDSDFGALYWPWLKINDTYNHIPMWVPPSGAVLAVYANSDNLSNPWIAPAGEIRGVVPGIIDVFSRPTLAERDEMYGNRNCINPIVQFADNANYLVWGQKTLQRNPTALDRVNVRRMMFYIEKRIRSRSRRLLFDPIDDKFTEQFIQLASAVLADVVSGRGIYDYFVQADSTLNTPDTIDRNEFRARIGVQPTKAAEFIFLEFAIYRTGSWTENA